MNWLAHIFVSINSIDYQLGNLLADPLKGKPWPGANEATRSGFTMHKIIDRYTDTNADVIQSKSRLGKKGYLKAVIVDMVYDHLLTLCWDQYSHVGHAAFMDQFNNAALNAASEYPDTPRQIVNGVVRSGYLTSYADLDGLHNAFNRIDMRLSAKAKARETATSYMPIVRQQLPGLKKDFERFFPDLLMHFKLHTGNIDDHWVR